MYRSICLVLTAAERKTATVESVGGGGILNTCTACTRLSDSQCEKLSVNDVLPKAKHMKYRGQTLPPVGGCEDRIKDLVGSLYINKQWRLHLRDMKSHVR